MKVKNILKIISSPNFFKLKINNLINNLYYFIEFTLRKFLLFFFFQKLYKINSLAVIRSLASSINLISKIDVIGKFYSLKSIEWGQKYQNQQTLYANVYRILVKKSLGFGIGFRISYHGKFDKAHCQIVYINRSNPKTVINEPVYLLPYYVTHIGHYTGEILGLLSMYIDLIPDFSNRKLLYIKGGNYTELLVNSLINKNKLFSLEPKVCLKNRIDILDGVILPSCHPWQNIIYLKNKLKNIPFYKKTENIKGIFLTSKKRGRIQNLDEVLDLFCKYDFKILDMSEDLTIENLSEIKNANYCFCEDASISHIPILHRDEKYYVFGGKRATNYNNAEYYGGYVFLEIDFPRRINIECEVAEIANTHFLSSKIKVDTAKLKVIIEDELSNLS